MKPFRSIREETGFTLVEFMASMFIFGLVLSMVLVMMSNVENLVSSSQQAGNSSSSAVTLVQSLTKVFDAVSKPSSAAYSVNSSPSATSPCWGSTTTPSQSSDQFAAGTVFAASGLRAPATTAILWAHPYDIRFCSSRGPTTHLYGVYRLWVNPSTCQYRSPNSFCELQLDYYGSAGATAPTTINQWDGILCNTRCQDENTAPWGTTPVAGTTQAPLFTYYGETGDEPSADGGSTPTGFSQPIDDDTAADAADLAEIFDIGIDMTVLDGNNYHATSPRATYKTQIWLDNVAS